MLQPFAEMTLREIEIQFLFVYMYRNVPKFSDRYAWANSADPDQTAPRGAV